MRVQLHPSFLRAAAWVLVLMLALTTVAYFWQGYYQNLWWSRGYFLSLLIPFTVMPVVVCVAWVPLHFEFSDTELIIQFAFRPLHTVPWDDLQYYGWFEGERPQCKRTSACLLRRPAVAYLYRVR